MAKVVLDSVASGYDLSKINANFQTLATALENTLSRDGTLPNSMSADLDMNGQRIINAVADGGNGFIWEGAWVTATSYAMNNLVSESGNTYICLSSHISGVFATDLAAGKWELVASKGSSGAGTGDMLSTNNLSDLTNTNAARTNLGVAIGIQVQAYDADIPTVAASQVEMEAGTESALRSMSPLRVAQAIDALSATGAAGDVQTFNAGGTWTKPSSGTMALIEVWGAGGGGARRSTGNSTGGAGGGYTLLWKKLSDLGATETVTIGSGGLVQSTDNTDGNHGGTTSFGSHITHIGGSGGHQIAAGSNALATQPGGVGAVQGPYSTTTTRPGANSAAYMTSAANAPAPIGTAGQSAAAGATDSICVTPNPSFMGGGCGGNVSTVLNAQSNGGTSVYGGAGGNGNKAGAGGTGTQPGGGGGSGTTQGGAGGDGRVKVSVF